MLVEYKRGRKHGPVDASFRVPESWKGLGPDEDNPAPYRRPPLRGRP